jgi:hypothetical protein
MNRVEMIDELLNDDIATIQSAMHSNDFEYLTNCLLYGIGYDSWTDDQITDEYNSRTWEGE